MAIFLGEPLVILDLLAGYLPYAIAALVIAVLLGVLSIGKSKHSATPLYDKQGALLSAAEQNFYASLLEAAPRDCIVFAKVRIADVLKVRKGCDKTQWQTAFNKISAKHFDFVLCDRESLSVRSAIELDDKSHNTQKTKARDTLVNEACKGAELPLLRISAASAYNVAQLRASISATMANLTK